MNPLPALPSRSASFSCPACDMTLPRPTSGRTARHRSVTRRVLTLAALASTMVLHAGLARGCPPVEHAIATPAPARVPTINIAIVLDTSNSMDGLIGQAKAQLWSVVNRFRECRRRDDMPLGGRTGEDPGAATTPRPVLRIALYQYGNSNLPASNGYVQQVSPLTTDLDLLSEQLFGLQTQGGSEYCGAAIAQASRDLSWGSCPGDLNLMFIAGNEPFTQGDVPYADAIAHAVRLGVRINTIHCGTYQEGVDGKWRDGATLGRGSYSVIDQSEDVRSIPTPFDDEIKRLGLEVNDTYMPLMTLDALAASARQSRADDAAKSLAPAAAAEATVARAIAKNSSTYNNAHWDLVDALRERRLKLEDVPEDQLPASLKGLSIEAQRTKVAEADERRTQINRRVAELTTKREQFLDAQRSQQGKDSTLGSALLEAITTQAREQGWQLGS